MLEVASTLQAEREQREATEFIEILKGLSDTEKAEVTVVYQSPKYHCTDIPNYYTGNFTCIPSVA